MMATSIEFGETDSEGPLRGRGIERLALKHRRLDLGQRHPHRIGKLERPGRGPHAVGAARQQLIAEQRPEPSEIVAHGRLPEPDARRGARDAALRQKRVERDQQIEVESA